MGDVDVGTLCISELSTLSDFGVSGSGEAVEDNVVLGARELEVICVLLGVQLPAVLHFLQTEEDCQYD